MNTDARKERALEHGLVPVLHHPEWRMWLCVKREACGCYLRVHGTARTLAKVAAKCPRCNDATPPAPVISLAAHSDTTYEKYRQQVLRDSPHLNEKNEKYQRITSKVDVKLLSKKEPAPKPARSIVDILIDEIAANVQYLLKHHRHPDR
jgi:hypothetical protein